MKQIEIKIKHFQNKIETERDQLFADMLALAARLRNEVKYMESNPEAAPNSNGFIQSTASTIDTQCMRLHESMRVLKMLQQMNSEIENESKQEKPS